MQEQIKKLRQKLKLSQEAFGKCLGITGAAVSRLESGNRNPSEQIVLAICREFHVREQWLREGDGDMFMSESSVDLNDPTLDDMDRQIITSYVNMQPEQRVYIKNCIAKIAAAQSPKSTDRK